MFQQIFVGLITIFLFSCDHHSAKQFHTNKKEQKLHKFYDFNLKIEIISPFIGVESRYLYINSGMAFFDEQNHIREPKEFKPNVLYYIDVFKSLNKTKSNINSPSFDSLEIKVTNSELDTIYSLTTPLFKFENFTNTSEDSISRPPKYTDGYSTRVELDLGFRGNKYITELNYGDTSQSNAFSKLYKYILTIRNSR